jgi:SAM-dependent methyltransferase
MSATADPKGDVTSQEYWTEHNVTMHRVYGSAEESLEHFHWRCDQYPGYLDLMPVSGVDGKVVLDYGCGPGHDVIGFAEFSSPSRLIAMEVSQVSLREAEARLKLHDKPADFIQISETDPRIPLEDDSVDYIHSSGVIHHTPDPVRILTELKRVLRPGGEMRIMIYNYDSVFVHLYVAYMVQILEARYGDESIRDAFVHTTDGPECPISNVYTTQEFIALAAEAGLECEHLGNAVSSGEMLWIPRRWEAILDERLGAEHRRFLSSLRFEEHGFPVCGQTGERAGVDGCYRLVTA